MLRSNCEANLLTTDNLVTAFGWLDDEILDKSSKKQVNFLLSQQFTKT